MKTLLSASALVALVALVTQREARATDRALPSLAAHLAADAASGFLDVASDPTAKIAIDGEDTSKTTPQQHLVLVVGHHKLTLVTLDGAHRRTIGFTVEAGQTTKLTVHLAS